MRKNNLQKRIQLQNMIIIALAITIIVLVFVSTTAAWYIRTRSDSVDIILSSPVNIYITEFRPLLDANGNPILDNDNNEILVHTMKPEDSNILANYNTRIFPGDKIRLRLGMQMGSEEMASSPAYVRVKLTITYENIYTGELFSLSDIANQNMIQYVDAPNPNNWILIDFNKYLEVEDEQTRPTDYWWVLKTTNENNNPISRIAKSLEQFVFVDGYIQLSKTEITNAQANCKFHFNYIVEAIQIPNVPDPIAQEGFGPWWNFALGDDE